MNETIFTRNAKLDGQKYLDYSNISNNWSYFRGDHFLNPLTGEIFWIGSLPMGMSHLDKYAFGEIQKIFTSHNKIKECVKRHIDSLISIRPTFTTAMKSLNSTLTDWTEDIYSQAATMNTNTLLDPLTKGVLDACVGEIGYFRLFERSEFKDPIKKLGIHSPDPHKINMIYGDTGLLKAITYQMFDDKIERQEMDYATGKTTFYYYSSEENFDKQIWIAPPKTLDLNYGWTIIQYRRESLITETIRNLQDGINLNLTMMINATSNAGFLERIITNAMPPGEFVEDGYGGWKFEPDLAGYVTGSGAAPIIQGIPIGNPGNPDNYTNPTVTYRPPVDTATFINANIHLIDLVYQEFCQSHMTAAGDGAISGVSRIQVKADFLNMINRDKDILQAVFNQLGTTALHLLLIYGGKSIEPLKKPKAVTTLINISNDSLLPEEITAISSLFTAGIKSHRTTLEDLGVKDVELELTRIQEERMGEVEQLSLTTTVEAGEGSLPTGFQKKKEDLTKAVAE